MNYAELIAEAERLKADCGRAVEQYKQERNSIEAAYHARMQTAFDRLAAAVRELAPPEGWRVTEYRNSEKKVFEVSGKYWIAANRGVSPVVRDDWERTNLPTIVEFPTASAAMAALDGESK